MTDMQLACPHCRAIKPPRDDVVDDLALNANEQRGCWRGVDMDLTIGEYRVVELLATNAASWTTYRAIYDRMHYAGFHGGEGPNGYRGNVRSSIKRIRNKIKALDPAFDRIENYNGFGYRWRPLGAPT